MFRNALLFIFLAGIFPCGFVQSAALDLDFTEAQSVGQLVDDEYERYKKRGDEYFDQGEYQNALRQYRNCLEVPNFENDPYAKNRIELCQKLIKLREQAYQSLNKGSGGEAVGTFEKMLVENPKDSITKVNLTDYWTREATKLYSQKDYEAAKDHYQKALQYASKPEMIQLQIQNSEFFIDQQKERAPKAITAETKPEPESETEERTLAPITIISGKLDDTKYTRPKRRIGVKLVTAAIGVGAGAYAYSLNSNYQSKLDKANSLGKIADPDGDDLILSPGEFNQWITAYQATKEAKKDRSKFMTSLGVVGAAAITEIILFLLPKTKKTTGISVGTATQSSGIAVRYIFK